VYITMLNFIFVISMYKYLYHIVAFFIKYLITSFKMCQKFAL